MSSTQVGQEDRKLALTRAELLAMAEAAISQQQDQSAAALSSGEGGDLPATEIRVPSDLMPTALSVGAPTMTVEILRVTRAGFQEATLWIGVQRAVLHPRGPADQRPSVVSVGLNLLPALLARALDLGPRPVVQADAFNVVPADLLRACRSAAYRAPWPADFASVDPRLWRLEWTSADGDAGSIAVLDLEQGGLWRPVSASSAEIAWGPTDSSTVWCGLGALFNVLSDVVAAEPT